ncbi:MAG: hypothetical protein KME59_18450 [Trichormus sp. ATA11-4-KO1]|jgi:hypothetical protein|nr:hypothetical protein [Trichormus sp. ATA11-4-KO1]
MAENLETGSSFNPPEGEITSSDLGIKKPLLAHKPLGQKLLSPKFLSPLGSKALSNFDPAIFYAPEISDYTLSENSFQNSPFFPEYQSQQLSKSNISAAQSPSVMHLDNAQPNTIQPQLERQSSISPKSTFTEGIVAENLVQQTQSLFPKNRKLPPSTTPKNPQAEPTIIQPQRESEETASPNPTVSAAIPEGLIVSSTTPAIQPQQESEETASEKVAVNTAMSEEVSSSSTTPINPQAEPTIIQAQLESRETASPNPTVSTAMSEGLSRSSTTPINPQAEPTIIQAQLESGETASPNPTVSAAIPEELITPSTTPINPQAEPTVIQAQLESRETASPNPTVSAAIPEGLIASSNTPTILNQSNIKNTALIAENIDNTHTNISINSQKESIEATVIQPKTETQSFQEKTEIPQLPQVLKNISVFSPLSQTSDLLTSNFVDETNSIDISPPTSVSASPSPSHHIQKSSTQDLPNSWSSIAELLGESTAVDTSPNTVVKPLPDERRWNHESTPLTSTMSQYSKSQPTVNSPKFSTSNKLIQAYTDPASSTSVQKNEDTYTEIVTNKQLSEDELESLEILAQEIYKILQYRVNIERERRGNNYLGRLPW